MLLHPIFISKDFNKHPFKNTISETLKMVNFIITWIAKKTTTFNPVWLKLIHTINYTHFPQLAPQQCAAAMAKRPAPGAVPGPVPWQLQG